MTMSYTYTKTFTRTHAKHLASKVVADLYQCALLYDHPSFGSIEAYEEELTTLLADGYVETYEFGFKLNGKRVLTWHYTVGPAGDLVGNSRSGSLARGVDIGDAVYFNFLTHSAEWFNLPALERERIEASLPIQRSFGSAPGDGDGHWVTGHAYSAGGVLVSRRVFKPW
jgi:HORMA domain-containing protein